MYQEAGTLLLASRLKRLGDRLFSEITKVYRGLGLGFEPSWFPIFFLLQRDKSHSVSTIARETGVTDSAVSQLIKQLKEKKLIKIVGSTEDKRAGAICLSPEGERLLENVKPVWQAIELTFEETLISGRHSHALLEAVSELETSLDSSDMAQRIKSRVELCQLEEDYTLSTDIEPHTAWIKAFLLTFTMKPHPHWPQNQNLLANIINNTETTHGIHLLMNQALPVALLITKRDAGSENLERIRFCAAERTPASAIEDFLIMKYCQTLADPVELSVHYSHRNFLYRLQKLGFQPTTEEVRGQADHLKLVYHPAGTVQEQKK